MNSFGTWLNWKSFYFFLLSSRINQQLSNIEEKKAINIDVTIVLSSVEFSMYLHWDRHRIEERNKENSGRFRSRWQHQGRRRKEKSFLSVFFVWIFFRRINSIRYANGYKISIWFTTVVVVKTTSNASTKVVAEREEKRFVLFDDYYWEKEKNNVDFTSHSSSSFSPPSCGHTCLQKMPVITWIKFELSSRWQRIVVLAFERAENWWL